MRCVEVERHETSRTLCSYIEPECRLAMITLGRKCCVRLVVRRRVGSRRNPLRYPAVSAFLILFAVLLVLVLGVSVGRALGFIQYAGLIAVVIVTAAFAVVLMFADDESVDAG